MKILNVMCLLLCVVSIGACKKTKGTQKATNTKTTPTPYSPHTKVWKGKVNGVAFDVKVTPYEHQPNRWYYIVDGNMEVSASSPKLAFRVFDQSFKENGKEVKYVNPFRFKVESTKADQKDWTLSLQYNDSVKRKPYIAKPGSKHTFKHDYRIGVFNRNRDAIVPGQTLRAKVCVSSMTYPTSFEQFNFCLVEAVIKVDSKNKISVALEPLLDSDKVKPAPMLYKRTLGPFNMEISPYKIAWEDKYLFASANSSNQTGLLYLGANGWRKTPLQILYTDNDIIIGNKMYANVPKDGPIEIKGQTVKVGGQALQSKVLTDDQLADAFPKPKEDGYQKVKGFKIFIRDGSIGVRMSGGGKTGDKKHIYAACSSGQEVKVVEDGTLLYRAKKGQKHKQYGKVKAGDIIETSMHKVWVNGKVRVRKER